MKKNLGPIFLAQLIENNIVPTSVEHKGNYIKVLETNKRRCMVKYANKSAGRRYWFGFNPLDIDSNGKYSDVILLIGNGEKIERTYIVPFNDLAKYLQSGEPIWIPKKGYSQYEANIFADRGYKLVVEKGNGEEMDVETFKVGDMKAFFSENN